MKKILMVLLLAVNLLGCGAKEGARIQNRYTDANQPIGYYSNEGKKRGGNVYYENDNDGAIVEILDHSFGWEGQRKNVARTKNFNDGKNGYAGNPTKPRTEYDKNFFEKDNRYSTADINYHGHLNDNQNVGKSSYYPNYDGKLVEKLNKRVSSISNVIDAQSVVYKNQVLIAVKLKDENLKSSTIDNIKSKTVPYLKGKSLHVVSNTKTFSRVRNINHSIKNGGVPKDINLDIKDLFASLNK